MVDIVLNIINTIQFLSHVDKNLWDKTKKIDKYNQYYLDYEYLKIGEEEKNYITLNKQTGGVVWYSYYWEEIGSTNTFKQIDHWSYYSCKATKELPF